MRSPYLLVLSEQVALAWVLREQRMAFSAHATRGKARRVEVGDRFFLYTTTRTFHNPSRDKGRVIGDASVTSPVDRLRRPLRIGDREFVSACALAIQSLAPLRQGVELAPLIPAIKAFPNADSWKFRLWQTLVPLAEDDARLLDTALKPIARNPADVMDEYVALERRGVAPSWPRH